MFKLSGEYKMSFINVNGKVVNDECKLEVGVNKKRVGSKSWIRYEKYMDSKNVGEYISKGGLKEDLRWDEKKGFVKIMEVIVKGKKVLVK